MIQRAFQQHPRLLSLLGIFITTAVIAASIFATLRSRAEEQASLAVKADLLRLSVTEDAEGNRQSLLTFTRAQSPSDMIYEIETSSDLDHWETIPLAEIEELQVTPDPDGLTEKVTLRVTRPLDPDSTFCRVRSTIPFVLQAYDAVPGDSLDADTDVGFSSLFNDRRGGTTAVNLVVTNTSGTAIPAPIVLVIEDILVGGLSDPSITVTNADGTNGSGKPFFDLSGQIPGPDLDPGESTAFRPAFFNNPNLARFSLVVSVVPGTAVPPSPVANIEIPTDPLGRKMIGVGEGIDVTVRAAGTAPLTLDLSQRGASPGSRGTVFFGQAGSNPTATVTTSGGANNVATIRVRGNGDSPSAFHGDSELVLSQGGTELSTAPFTALLLVCNPEVLHLFNDRSQTLTIGTIPATADLQCDLGGCAIARTTGENVLSPESFSFAPGPSISTGASGTAQVDVTANAAGQGWKTIWISCLDVGIYVKKRVETTGAPTCRTCDPCGSGNSILPFSGEKRLSANDLTIPGRGFDWHTSRTFRSQTSHYRAGSHNHFGVDWCLSYMDDFLVQDGDNVLVVRSDFRVDQFVFLGPGRWEAPIEFYEELTVNGAGDFELRNQSGTVMTFQDFAHPSIPGRLIRQEDRNGNFMSFLYDEVDPNGVPASGDEGQRLVAVVDTMGREIRYRYYAASAQSAGGHPLTVVDAAPSKAGRLAQIEDFSGRVLTYDYDAESNLVRSTGPAVTGTPNGNDFPIGKTYRYKYTTTGDLPGGLTPGQGQRLLHNLTHIWYPNEVGNNPGVNPPDSLARERVTYGLDPGTRESFDRGLAYAVGGTNASGIPAGGTTVYEYERIGVAFGPQNPFLQVTITDRRGNVDVNTYTAWDTMLESRRLTRGFRGVEPATYRTTHRYDLDKNPLTSVSPEGNVLRQTFDSGNPDRFQQGNATRSVQTPDARGGDQTQIASEAVYEPIYNQVATRTDPRGLDPGFTPPIPDLAGRSQAERYTTRYFFDYQEGDAATVLTMLADELNTTEAEVQNRLNANGIPLGLGDLNGDGDTTPRIGGNVVRMDPPIVALLPGSNQQFINGPFQQIATLYRYNQFGQLISTVDPEGNEHVSNYFPESDPDGDGGATPAPADGRSLDGTTGGYLAQTIRDNAHLPGANNNVATPPTQISSGYSYDDVGNLTSSTDGRGIRHDFVVNQLNQIVQTTRAAAVPGVSATEPLPLTAFAFVSNTAYDFNDNVVQNQVEDRGDTSNTGGFVDSSYQYDILDNPVTQTQEVDVTETLVTRYRYDANENRILTLHPEGNADGAIYDERDLLFQQTRGLPGFDRPGGAGTVPSTTTYNYDLNGNLIELVDADDTDTAPGNNSTIAGAGDVTRFTYDGFDRQSRSVDAVGNEVIRTFDPASNTISELRRGPLGGPSPTDLSGAANEDLSRTDYVYDELNRLVQQDRSLFVAAGLVTVRAPNLSDGATDIGKGDLSPGDGKVSTRTEYDRNSRSTFQVQDDLDTYRFDYDGASRRLRTLDPEGNTADYAYDDNSNLVEQRETDVSQVAGIADEIFLTTSFYDSLNRLERSVDNIGQTHFYLYDSRNNLTATADAQGPVTGASIARRAFAPGALTVNAINEPGNVTTYQYDGINRRLRSDQILTATGNGDGTFAPAPDPAQGGGDGIIRVRQDWDKNSQLASLTDDNGFQTQYRYDNLDRQIRETKGICTLPVDPLSYRCDPPTSIVYQYDPDSNRFRTIDENGSILDCYDALNRKIRCDITRAPGVVGTTLQTHEYDGLSRKTRCTDNNEPGDVSDDSAITFAYDSLSRVIEEGQKIGTLSAKAISSSWRAESLRTELTYPNGRVVESTYDTLDRLNTIADQGAALPIADYDYLGTGRVLQRAYPQNGTRMTYLDNAGTTDAGYDGLRRPVQLRHLRNDNSLVVGFTHTYDRMNNKLDEAKLHDATNSEVYAYDSAYRLTSFTRPNPGSIPPLHSNWDLDGLGNWNQVDAETREHSSFNELIGRNATSLDHDDNGNQTNDGTHTYQWDALNRLRTATRINDSQVVGTYTYDGINRRAVKNANPAGTPATTHFYYDGWQVLEEQDTAGTTEASYVYGNYIDEALTMDRGGQTRYYHQNTLFSVFALTNSTATTAERYQYNAYGCPTIIDGDVTPVPPNPWGTPQSAVANPYMFTGRHLDEETGLYYFRARYFDYERGRFKSRDSFDRGKTEDLYAYVRSRPTWGMDPLGLWSVTWTWNPTSHGSGKWASVEGHLGSGETETNWWGKPIDFIGTRYASKGRSGPPSHTGNSLRISLRSLALGASFVRDKSTGSRLQWSGENEYTVILRRAPHDSKCAEVKFTGTRSTIASPARLRSNACHKLPNDACKCCPPNSFKLGILHLTHAFTTLKGADAYLSSTLDVRVSIVPKSNCP